MYNQEIKEQFLQDYLATGKEKNGCRAMFETVGQFEAISGKDLAEMSKDEVVQALESVDIGTYSSAAGIQSVIKAYVKWCMDNFPSMHFDRSLDYLEISDIDVSGFYSKTIFQNEDELIFELESVRHFDEGFTEGIILVFAWLGIEQKNALSVKIEDVNLTDRTIYLRDSGKIISFSERIADVLKVYERTKVGYRSAGGRERPVYRDDSFGNYIRRYCPASHLGVRPFDPANIRKSINDINQLYVAQGKESRLWNGNVVASGALYRIHTLELSGVDVFSLKNKDLVIEAFGVKSKLYEIHWMYRNYKRAFNL